MSKECLTYLILGSEDLLAFISECPAPMASTSMWIFSNAVILSMDWFIFKMSLCWTSKWIWFLELEVIFLEKKIIVNNLNNWHSAMCKSTIKKYFNFTHQRMILLFNKYSNGIICCLFDILYRNIEEFC